MNNVTPLLINPAAQAELKVEEINSSDKAGELLIATLAAFEQWRSKKKMVAEPIPEELWQRIFSLEPYYSSALLRRSFKLNMKQYTAKREALFSATNPPPTPVGPINAIPQPLSQATVAPVVPFCEVKIKKPNPYAHEPLPSGKTLIVEFCRNDSQIMKIHTTQDSIPLLMRQFLGE